ncbi:MAG: signal recognition particle subunit SRP19/SEC65 family protein [Thermoplasmata archaeon]
MVSRGDLIVVLYPTYFDSSRSREEGRRVPKNLATPAPTVEEVRDAAKRLGYRVESEDGVAHPSRPRKKEGRVLILGGGRKTAIIRSVAQEIRAHRS